MINICLTRTQIDALKPKLRKIGGTALTTMTSNERVDFFTEAMGSSVVGKQIAGSFEKAMVGKQRNALKNWAKQVFSETEQRKPSFFKVVKKIDFLTDRGVLSPNAAGEYLETLVSTELGVDIETEEIQKINELSQDIKDKKAAYEADPTNKKKRVAYGDAIISTYDYVQTIAPVKNHIVADIANLPKSLMSTLDFSAPFRQGWGMMSRPEFYKSVGSMFQYAFSESKYKELQSDIISRPTYPLMKKAGLRISVLADNLSQREEQFMSTLLDKIPVPEKMNFVKKFMGGSERAYAGFLSKLRADVFDNLIQQAAVAGESIDPKSQTIRDLAHVVNDFTGSGNIGANDRYSGAVPLLNAAFFAPRKISATVNMFNPERYLNPKTSPTARKAALRQLLGSLAISATLIALHSFLSGDDDETDPRSADFGKIKNGITRFDLTGGNGTYAVLLARLFSNQTKSSTTGMVSNLGEGFKSDTRLDIITKWGRNKLSPIASYVADFLAGTDAVGQPFNVTNDTVSRVTPLIIQDIISLAKEDPDNLVYGILATMFGFGVQSYAPTELTPEKQKQKDKQDKKDALKKEKIEKKFGKNDKVVKAMEAARNGNTAEKAQHLADVIGYGEDKLAREYKVAGVITTKTYETYRKLEDK